MQPIPPWIVSNGEPNSPKRRMDPRLTLNDVPEKRRFKILNLVFRFGVQIPLLLWLNATRVPCCIMQGGTFRAVSTVRVCRTIAENTLTQRALHRPICRIRNRESFYASFYTGDSLHALM